MSSTSFTQKLLEFDIVLSTKPTTNQPSTFDSTGNNTVTLSNCRASVRIEHSGLPKGSTARIKIYGLAPSLMNQLSTLGLAFNVIAHNTISVRAGDVISGLSTVFVGTIWSGVPDFSQAPEVPFSFDCIGQELNLVVPALPSSFPQGVSIASVMSGLATRMGYGFENNNVNVTLPPTYLQGSVMDQVKQAAETADIVAELVPGSLGQVLAIWPKGGHRSSIQQSPLVSPDTGMIGYPIYSQVGLIVKTIYNPQITIGGLIQIQSSLPKASGTWIVLDVNHELDAQIPEGLWQSTLTCFNPNYAKYGVPTVV